ncbi:hypothetical protein [Polaribacter butkevichii]|uniref:Glycosyltransferase RgtA/B/C/D-like domain-containing protein n=1 Tax=Polaribacter butkevichii TaxID=218490 RepID=A0A2P6CEJ7_9FLAO|nr:hypothetical protein [Polaribacter butkevichii]PQJ73331.1 hypothetical protein BTO14_08680 [Polaribacter butkevichii]
MFVKIFTPKNTKRVLYLFLLVGVLLTIFWNFPFNLKVGENDGYIKNFAIFNNTNLYTGIASGTSVVYFLALKFLNFFLNNINNSFFLLNLISQVAFIFIGVKVLNKEKSKESKIIYASVLSLFLVKAFQMKAYSGSSNDYLLSVFIIWILYEIVKSRKNVISDIKIGVLMAISLSIRKSFILFFPLFFILVFDQYKLKNYIKTGVSFLLILLVFHFPAIIENHTLSFYSKEPNSTTYNWITRNYLGLKRIFEQGLVFSSDSVWSYSWTMVEEYTQTAKFIPQSITSVITNDPAVFIKAFFYNVGRNLVWTLRFSGVIAIVPFFYKIKLFNKYLVAYFTFLMIISAVGFTVTEFRWFWGYDILMFLGGYMYLKNIKEKQPKFLIISISLITVLLFNVRTIISLL